MALQQNIDINVEYNNSSNLIQKLNDIITLCVAYISNL